MAAKPADLEYGVDDVPPAGRLFALGLQYAILVSVYLIIVVLVARAAKASPEVTASLVSLGLIAGAIGTAVQAWNGRFFGSGYLAPPVYSAIYFGPAILAAKAGGLPAVAGMTVFAALCEIGLSRLLDRLRVVFQPSIAGLAVLVVGIQLGIVGISETLDTSGEARPDWPLHLGVGALTLGACIGFSIWGKGVFRLVASLAGLVLGVIGGILTGVIGPPLFAAVAAAPPVALPDPSFLAFDFIPALVPAFIASAIAAALRTTGVVTTAERINDANWKRPDMENIGRGVAGDGIGCLVGGLLGCPGMSSAASLVGLSSATAATSRAIAYAAAAILLVFAFIPKIGAAIIGLPLEIAGAILVFTASFLVVGGMQILMTRGLDLRAGFAVSFALLMGLLTQAKPEFFSALPEGLRIVTNDMLTVSLAVGIALTLLFRIGIRKTDRIVWAAPDATETEIVAMLDREKKGWRLGDDVVQRARDTVDRIAGDLEQGRYLEAPLAIAASFDELMLRIDMTYRGRPPLLPAHPGRASSELHHESAAADGLIIVATGAHADRTAVATDGETVTVRLWFGV